MTEKVLLIDDSKASIAYFQEVLKDYNIECVGTASASEGIQMALEQDFDCVITDHEMPEMTGTDVTKLLKEAFVNKVLPIVVLTSKNSEEIVLECLEGGADNFILKTEEPFKIALKIKNAVKIGELQKALIQDKQTESMRNMITTYNHEFNNVLAILQMDIKILKKKYFNNSEDEVRGLLKTTNRLIKLVEDINKITIYKDQKYIDGIQMVKMNSSSEE